MYKALMLDFDGTLVKYGTEKPTPKVIDALQKASKQLTACIVTGRKKGSILPILKEMNLESGLTVTSNGSQIIEAKTGKILWQQYIDIKSSEKLWNFIQEQRLDCYFLNAETDERMHNVFYATPPKVSIAGNLAKAKAEEINKQILKIPNLHASLFAVNGTNQWGVVVCHAEATKQHAILKVAEILKIDTKDIIGVGDGYNDFPLLMACGIKVAMGNAPDDLKAIADYVAPDVNDDGVVNVIERFILSESKDVIRS